jgi:hypothetical protein
VRTSTVVYARRSRRGRRLLASRVVRQIWPNRPPRGARHREESEDGAAHELRQRTIAADAALVRDGSNIVRDRPGCPLETRTIDSRRAPRRTCPRENSVFSIQYSVFSIQYSVFSIQYSVFSGLRGSRTLRQRHPRRCRVARCAATRGSAGSTLQHWISSSRADPSSTALETEPFRTWELTGPRPTSAHRVPALRSSLNSSDAQVQRS